MHGLSTTSPRPNEPPPHGPFLICFGQVCGHTYSVQLSTQLPHASHPNTGRLMAYSTFSTAVASAGERSIARNRAVTMHRSQLSRDKGKRRASQSIVRPTDGDGTTLDARGVGGRATAGGAAVGGDAGEEARDEPAAGYR